MQRLTIEELLRTKEEALALELLTGPATLERELRGPDVGTPGLLLAGFTYRFPADRMQVLGETEVSFLASLSEGERRGAIARLLEFDVPAIFITKKQEAPIPLVELADERGVPILRSALKTAEFFARIKPYLEDQFAARTTIHGSLADVFGVGLLFVGRSGIGKSEAVLDLVERGHRFVADDVVLVSRRGNSVLIGRGPDLQRHHMEIRGVGIIDVSKLFGVRATRQQKRIEVVVQLEMWDDGTAYDRTGLDRQSVQILDVNVPKVVVPLTPGKNITVITEVVAMNHLLRYAGVDSAVEFHQRLRRHMQGTREYLEEDNE